ncbi:MAG: ATP-binding protein, partial [Cyclobacteriaceae bacterium]|nr:ATP-binding protein [Cyclobacteriaceae bacterium]
YKIDLSMVVSKFIGETEKNLANLFDKAENKDWILFFDEADALFGKRTSVRDAHDKYANQEVSFLLQRTETYTGMVILATNFKSNIDVAFTRRFQSHIYFSPPKYDDRFKLWKKAFPEKVKLEKKIDLSSIARQYELTGANIINIVQYTCLKALSKQQKVLLFDDLIDGIRKEISKEGKAV